jgi:hypothetical protein
MGTGRNLAYRKNLFHQIVENPVYRKTNSGDDDILVNQLATAQNARTCIHPEALMISIPEQYWIDWFRQKLRHLSAGRTYTPQTLFILSSFYMASVLVFVGPLWMLMQGSFSVFVGIISVSTLMIHALICWGISKKLGFRITWISVVCMEPVYLLYLLIFGTISTLSNTWLWK